MTRTMAIIDDDPHDLEVVKAAILKVDQSVQCISFLFPVAAVRVIAGQLTKIPDVLIDVNMQEKMDLNVFSISGRSPTWRTL